MDKRALIICGVVIVILNTFLVSSSLQVTYDKSGNLRSTIDVLSVNVATGDIVDTNASTACAGNEFLAGDGTCQNVSAVGDTDTNASTACAGDQVLLGNGTCQSSSAIITAGSCVLTGSCTNVTYGNRSMQDGQIFFQDQSISEGIRFNYRGGLTNNTYFVYNNSNSTLQLFVNGLIQQSWGGSTTIFESLMVLGASTLNITLNASGDIITQSLFIGNGSLLTDVCLSNGTNCAGVSGVVDTNATTACASAEYLAGNGTCLNVSASGDPDTNASTACAVGEYLDGDNNCVAETNLNVNNSNSTDFWDLLDSPADILGSLINNDFNWLNLTQILTSFFTQAQSDARYVNIDGDNMTGNLNNTANFTGAFFIGDGSELTNLPSAANCSASGSCAEIVYNNTDGYFVNFSVFQANRYLTDQGTFGFNFVDDGSELTMNVTEIIDSFMIETDNSKLALYNNPAVGNDFKVFQAFSREGGDVTEFVVTKVGAGHTSYFIRSLALVGNSTTTPTPFNCSTFATHIDCSTDATGADFFVADDAEIDGELFVDGTGNSSLDGYLNVGLNVSASWFLGFINASDVQNAPWVTSTSDTNETSFVNNLTALNCTTGNQAVGVFNNGTVVCAEDMTYNSSYYLMANPYSYYNSTNPSPDTNISNTDTNASTACAGAEILLGNGTCSAGTFLDSGSESDPHWSSNWTSFNDSWGSTQNDSYYLITNPFGFFNATNPSPDTNISDTNETTRIGNLVGVNCTGTDKYSNITNDGTLICSADTGGAEVDPVWTTNWSAFNVSWGSTFNASYYLFSNPFSFFNATNPSPDTNISDTNETTRFNTLIGTNCSIGSAYTNITDSGTLVCSVTIATEVDPTWTGNWSAFNVSWGSTFNSSYYLYSNPFTFYNLTNPQPNTFGYYNVTSPQPNTFGYYNSSSLPADVYLNESGDTLTGNLSLETSSDRICNGTSTCPAYIYHNGTGWLIKG